jgi:hypothetical protein
MGATLPPAVCLAVLLGAGLFDHLRIDWAAAAPYHQGVRAAFDQVPRFIGLWDAPPEKDQNLSADEIALLQPNATLIRTYFQYPGGGWVNLMVIQCQDPRNMIGHYPPVCYPSAGWTQESAQPQEWHAAGMVIPGTEYVFSRTRTTARGPGLVRIVIRDFFLLPGHTIAPDMTALGASFKNYRQLAYGAAQVQLMFDGRTTAEQRDDAFGELIGANAPLVEALISGGAR